MSLSEGVVRSRAEDASMEACAGMRREKAGWPRAGAAAAEKGRHQQEEGSNALAGRQTYFSSSAICFTASTAPGRGSRSRKKFSDSHMLMAFS